jgi:hypothetical protein
MKDLSVVRQCHVIALILGFLVAWSVVTPQRIVGETLVGREIGCPCTNVKPAALCANKDGTCTYKNVECDTGGDSDCEREGASQCYLLEWCVNEANEMCN